MVVGGVCQQEDCGEDCGGAGPAWECHGLVVCEGSQEGADQGFHGHEDGGFCGGGARHSPAVEEIRQCGAEDSRAGQIQECRGILLEELDDLRGVASDCARQCGEEEGIEEECQDGVFSECGSREDAIERVEESGGDSAEHHSWRQRAGVASHSGDQDAPHEDQSQGEQFPERQGLPEEDPAQDHDEGGRGIQEHSANRGVSHGDGLEVAPAEAVDADRTRPHKIPQVPPAHPQQRWTTRPQQHAHCRHRYQAPQKDHLAHGEARPRQRSNEEADDAPQRPRQQYGGERRVAPEIHAGVESHATWSPFPPGGGG